MSLSPIMHNRGKGGFPHLCSAEVLPIHLARWSFVHAVVILLATTVSLTVRSLWTLLFFAAFSFSSLILTSRPCWTERGAFGSANGVTAIRLAGVLALPLLCTTIDLRFVTGIGLVLLVTDGLDGWLARRYNQASEFGAYFDKETDAFFLLVLCILAVLNQRLWPWVLISGLLRYLFVVVIHLFRPNVLKEHKSPRARIVYVLIMVAMLGSFLPYPKFYKPLAVIGTLGLIGSFMIDFYLGSSKD